MTRACWLAFAAIAVAQQVPDTGFEPSPGAPTYSNGNGPLVALDEGHRNFHTIDGRYAAFAKVLRADGFAVEPSRGSFALPRLAKVRVLAIANALHPDNDGNWRLPTPSAFTAEEIRAVAAFVENGGGLLLIADHMPFAGAAEQLGRAVGVEFTNGYTQNARGRSGVFVFRPGGGELELLPHPVLRGGIDAVATFTGSAFRLLDGGQPLLRLGKGFQSALAERGGQVTPATPRTNVDGWLQGATLTRGKGRIAVFAEAAMFSAQWAGEERRPMGMNAPEAKWNQRFLANVVEWLAADR